MIDANTTSRKRGVTVVYLGYVDDSGTTNEKDRIGVYAAVLFPADDFPMLEFFAGLSVMQLIPQELHDDFEEFHAAELFNGWGVFKDVPELKRHRTIEVLLNTLLRYSNQIALIYGAVDKDKLKRGVFATADPFDIAFRECLDGIETWLTEKSGEKPSGEAAEFCLLIADDVNTGSDGKNPIKDQLKKTFKEKRSRFWKRYSVVTPENADEISKKQPFLGDIWHCHDDLYFGDSKYSVGIQMADLCAYFVGLHLAGDKRGDAFYDIFKDRIRVARVKP